MALDETPSLLLATQSRTNHSVCMKRFAPLNYIADQAVALQSDNKNSTVLCTASSNADGMFGIGATNQSVGPSPFLSTLLDSLGGPKEIGIFLSDTARYLYTTETYSYSYGGGSSTFGELTIG